MSKASAPRGAKSSSGSLSGKPKGSHRLGGALRREQILSVALELFGEQGYGNTTTASIAERVGVSEPVLYQHFKSKKHLLVTVLAGNRERLLRRWEALVGGIECPLTRLEAICMDWAQVLSQHANAVRLTDNLLAEVHDTEIREILRNDFRQYQAFLAGIIDDAKRQGLTGESIDSQMAAWQLISFGRTIGMIRHLDLRGIPVKYFMEKCRDMLMQSLGRPVHPIERKLTA